MNEKNVLYQELYLILMSLCPITNVYAQKKREFISEWLPTQKWNGLKQDKIHCFLAWLELVMKLTLHIKWEVQADEIASSL